MVSGMLTAIRDFARDSFGGRAEDTLDALPRRRAQLPDRARARTPTSPSSCAARRRTTCGSRLQRAIEAIHLQQTARPRALLRRRLDLRRRAAGAAGVPRVALSRGRRAGLVPQVVDGRRSGGWRCWPAGSACAGWSSGASTATWRRSTTQPGLVVVNAAPPGRTLRRLGTARSAGGRSGIARRRHGPAPDRVEGRWELYQALDPRLAAAPRRGRSSSRPTAWSWRCGPTRWWPPARPPTAWVREASLLARTLPGVRELDLSGIQNAELRGASRRLEAAMVQFVRGTSELVSGQDQAIGTMIAELRQLDAAARQARVRLQIVVTGHTDADGAFDRNLTLSRERAAAVVAALPRAGVAVARLRVARRRQRRADRHRHHRGRQTTQSPRRRPYSSARRQLIRHDSEEDLHARLVLGGQDQPGRPLRQQRVLRQVPHDGGRQDRQEGARRSAAST